MAHLVCLRIIPACIIILCTREDQEAPAPTNLKVKFKIVNPKFGYLDFFAYICTVDWEVCIDNNKYKYSNFVGAIRISNLLVMEKS